METGIGRASALSFAREGCLKISIADRNLAGLKETSDMIDAISTNIHVIVVEVDMAKESDVEKMISKTIEALGRVDYVVNAAGMYLAPSFQHSQLAIRTLGLMF